jgi:hypothetical protein
MVRSLHWRSAWLAAALLIVLAPAALHAQPCGTPGRDGSGNLTGIVNTYYPGTATANPGDQQISVGSPDPGGSQTAIAAGDLLLVIQMQDATINSGNDNNYGGNNGTGAGYTALNNAGGFEYVVATGPVAGGVVPIVGGSLGPSPGAGGLINTYTNADWSGSSTTQGQRRFQVIRVPQYASPTLTSGLTALGWNGRVGGVLAIDVDATLALGGATVSVDSLGFRGGGGLTVNGSDNDSNTAYRTLSTHNHNGAKGEGIVGTPRYVYNGSSETDNGSALEGYPNGSFARGAPGTAGGGGTDDSTTTNQNNSGGGGGGNGGAGGHGGNTWDTNAAKGGKGGVAFPSGLSGGVQALTVGGGGGGGCSNNTGPGHGGPGGGLIMIRANQVSGTGTLSANGAKPPASTQDGAGGGGAGGTVMVDVQTGNLNNLTINAQGGNGGDVNWPDNDQHGPGGGAGGGAVFVSAGGATISVRHGNHGASGNPVSDNFAFGSANGSDGTSTNGPITINGGRPGYKCITSQALITALRALPLGGGQLLEWETSSQAGTAGFYLFRFDPVTRSWLQLNARLLPAAIEAPQGGLYRFRDDAASPFARHAYSLLEIEGNGHQRSYGPFTMAADWAATPAPMIGDYAVSPRRPEALDALALPPSAGGAGGAEADSPPASGGAEATALPLLSPAAAVSNLPGGPALKLYVQTSALYAVSAAAIGSGLGVPAATAAKLIAKGLVTLTSHGAPVLWQATPDSSAIRFVGNAPTGIYSKEDVYWLSLGQPGPRMGTASAGSPVPSSSPLSFPATANFKQNLFAGVAIAVNPESDYWFWKATISGDPTYGTQSFPLDVHGVAGSGNATLTVHLQGASDTGAPGEHHLRLLVNGTPIGETTWQGVTRHDATFILSSALLHEGSNDVDVVGVLDPGVPFSITYTGSFDLAYRRLAVTDGSPLVVTADAGPMTVSGFHSANLAVYDISRAQTPAALTGAIVDTAGGTYRVSFTAGAPGRSYLAVDTSLLAAPRIEAWQPPRQPLRSPANHADHLIIVPAALSDAAATLAAHRQTQGLDSRVVPLGQIYDEFNDGLASPWAIQRFLAYTAGAWQKRPASVVLAGNGSFDYKDYLGLGGNLVPPLMLSTPDGLFASDGRFLSFPGGGAMTIGRLTARSAQELAGIVAKLAAYESSGPAAWQQQVLLAADVPDGGGQFEVESNLAGALVHPPFLAGKLYVGQLPAGVARQQLLADLAGGLYLFNYIGHGGLDVISTQSLLTNQDAAALTNGPRLPLVAVASCIIGRFEVPGFQPLAAALLNNPAGGAAAVWAPSGLTFNAQTSTLDRALLPWLFAPQVTTLGSAIQAGGQAFLAAGGTPLTLALYNLFGDPALLLQKPH